MGGSSQLPNRTSKQYRILESDTTDRINDEAFSEDTLFFASTSRQNYNVLNCTRQHGDTCTDIIQLACHGRCDDVYCNFQLEGIITLDYLHT